MSAAATEAMTSSNSYCAQYATRSSTLRRERSRTLAFAEETQPTCRVPPVKFDKCMASEEGFAAIEGFGERLGSRALHATDARQGAEEIGREPWLAGLAAGMAQWHGGLLLNGGG